MRSLLALSIVAILAGAGCRMCASPYDYCGPVVECDDQESASTMPATRAAPESVPTPQAKPYSEAPATPPAPTPEPAPQASRTRSSMRQAQVRRPYLSHDQNSDTVVPQSGQVYQR